MVMFLNRLRDPAKLAAYQKDVFEDLIGTKDAWPAKFRDLVYKHRDLNYAERFNLVCFLLGNGVDPKLIKTWLSMKYNFGGKYQAEIERIVTRWNDPKDDTRTWNVAMNRWFPDFVNPTTKFVDYEKVMFERVQNPPACAEMPKVESARAQAQASDLLMDYAFATEDQLESVYDHDLVWNPSKLDVQLKEEAIAKMEADLKEVMAKKAEVENDQKPAAMMGWQDKTFQKKVQRKYL